jgi:hypothetical protein
MTSTFRQGCALGDLIDDPLTRLMMASDGVSEQELVTLLRRVRRARRMATLGETKPEARIVAFRGAGGRAAGVRPAVS